MRVFTIVCAFAMFWLFGWLTATFGLGRAILASSIAAAPVFAAWRMCHRERSAARKEYLYLGVLMIVSIAGSTFVIAKSFDAGLDRLVVVQREYQEFRRQIDDRPEYSNVVVSYVPSKGGIVSVSGTVGTKDSRDKLIEMLNRTVRYGWHIVQVDYLDRIADK